ncbi:Sec23/Sec24 zinc finger-containing protein [Pseudobutyrivibrio sp. LB2011]|uniref:Sec23/Sec24 zinc finger-containing protein n=1 Tax=Pseudobutyrivibrio sp. LB2011 TaxID=1408312 RepID=UPI0005D183A2|nr:Sec23/Sec24 zinc finger-containing protein [Pseudobutyrivibrio sp. LB2011]
MVPTQITCKSCNAQICIDTYRKFTICPYCNTKIPFEGFEYETIDWTGSMYAHVKKWTDCPACRSKNMYLGPMKRIWKCPDCGYSMKRKLFDNSVLWFCDECETFLNIQKNFNTSTNQWKCTVCGAINDVSKDNIL